MAIDLEELAALDAVGALNAEEQRTLHDQLAAAPSAARAAAAQLYDVVAEMASHAGLPGASQRPSSQTRERLMARVSRPGTFSVLASEGRFVPSPIPGIIVKILSLDRARDSAVMLLKADPGTRYPAHHHGGAEECYVLSGEVTIHGRTLRAGDFHHAEPGSDHDVLFSEAGCEVLLVVAASDYGL